MRATGAIGMAMGLVGAGTSASPAASVAAPPAAARAVLNDATGVQRGRVLFTEEADAVRVQVTVSGLSEGWHGFHVHTTGDCAVGTAPAAPFTAAGGHLGSGPALGQVHGSHDGDMPALYASADGVARATFRTDNFTMAQLLDADGSAVIVHAAADNLANIPTDAARYRKAPFGSGDVGPDTATLATGDSGARQRCGLVESGGLRFGGGYWLAATDGGVFAFGDAGFHGSAAGAPLNRPVTGMAAAPGRRGYWLAAEDGGVFAFGDAAFAGSAGGVRLNQPVVGIAAPKGQVTAVLRDALGQSYGTVQLSQEGPTVRVDVLARGLSDGWHGFHVHAVGTCAVGDPASPFTAAGGHLGSGAGQVHGAHDGDLPPLYSGGGIARATFRTDNLSVAELLDADGSAVIVHASADNLANIPADAARYRKAPFGAGDVGPDTATLATGDSGARRRCGVVQRTGAGYWLAASDGGVFAYGEAGFFGSTGGIPLNQPVKAMAATPSGQGYWLVAADGGVFAFGDATFLGSTGSQRLGAPIVGMAATSTGGGYWLVGADGGVFAFGDAVCQCVAGQSQPTSPVVALAPTPTNDGYWLFTAAGGVVAYGDAELSGSVGSTRLSRPVRAAAAHSS